MGKLSSEQKVRLALAAPDPDPAFVDGLEARLKLAPHSGRAEGVGRRADMGRHTRGWRLAWVVGGVLAILLLALIVAGGPARVLAGVRGLLSYIPGVGFVDGGEGFYVLPEPLSQMRDGVTVTVEEVIAGAEQTVLTFSVEGIRQDQRPAGEDAPRCGGAPVLRAAPGADGSAADSGGQTLEIIGGEGQGWAGGYRSRLLFPGLDGARELTLELPCLDDVAPLAAPENWSFVLSLQPAPDDFQALPVILLSTPAHAGQPGAPQTPGAPAGEPRQSAPGTTAPGESAPGTESPGTAAQTPAAGQHGVHFSVDSLVELEDGFLLSGQFAWAESGYSMVSFGAYDLEVVDANGVRVLVETDRDNLTWRQAYSEEEKRMTWAVRTAAKGYATPLSLRLSEVSVDHDISQFFELDLGPNPQPGQVWELGQDVLVEGRRLHVIRASLLASPDGRAGTYGLTIEMSVDPQEINSVSISDPDNHSAMLATSGGRDGRGSLIQMITYDYQPTGLRRIEIRRLSFTLQGSWTASVELPPSAAAAPPAGPPEMACLNVENWEALQSLPRQPLPDGVGGKVLSYGPPEDGSHFPTLYVSDLNGENRRKVSPGGLGDPSAGSIKMVYDDQGGVYLADLQSGEIRPLDWALPGGALMDDAYNPHLSPDEQWIAFERSGQGIFLANISQETVAHVAGTGYAVELAGWTPDGAGLLVIRHSSEAGVVQRLDLTSGETIDLYPDAEDALLSPDGLRLAVNERIFGDWGIGLSVVNLDGSGKRLIATLGAVGSQAVGWSPDGRWLLVTASEYGMQGVARYLVALVDPDTCEIIRLPGLTDGVAAWSP